MSSAYLNDIDSIGYTLNTEESDNMDDLRDELEEYLDGLCMAGSITKDKQDSILDDFDTWCETADIGDTYLYDGRGYTVDVA